MLAKQLGLLAVFFHLHLLTDIENRCCFYVTAETSLMAQRGDTCSRMQCGLAIITKRMTALVNANNRAIIRLPVRHLSALS
jgi:hypothetical protein